MLYKKIKALILILTLECLQFYCLSNKQLVIQTTRRKLLFSISATSDTWLVFVIPLESFVSLYGTFLEDFVMQREQKSHEQRRRHLEVSSTTGIAGSLPIKPLAQGVVWRRRSSLLWVPPVMNEWKWVTNLLTCREIYPMWFFVWNS